MISSWNTVKNLAFKFFGRTLEPVVPYFESIKSDLLKAGMGLSLTEYVYSMFFVLLLLFMLELPTLVIIFSIALKTAPLAFLLSFTILVVLELIAFFTFYTYPSAQAGKRRKQIDETLPFAATYMGTVASSGAPPITMFKVMAEFKDYGETSKEAEKIYRDVEAFGMDLPGAIRKTASRTPSEELKELLWGIDAVVTSGGNLGNYLHDKSRLFMQEYRRRLEQFSRTLSLLIEVYLTVILVGSIFFIIMTSLFSIFGGGGDTTLFFSFLQFIIIFIVMPFVSIGFIFLVKTISP